MKKTTIIIVGLICILILAVVAVNPKWVARLLGHTGQNSTTSAQVNQPAGTTTPATADTANPTEQSQNLHTTTQTAYEDWIYTTQAPGNLKDEIDGVTVDSAGNILWGGPFQGTLSFNGVSHAAKNGIDISLTKLSPDGKTLWFNSIDSGGDDYMWDTTVAPGGDMYLSSGFGGSLTVNGTTYVAARDGSAFFARVDGNTGQMKWVQVAGVPGTGTGLVDASKTAGGDEVKTDSNGNLVAMLSGKGTPSGFIIGGKHYPSYGPMDGFVVTIDPNGNYKSVYEFGGNGRQQGRAIGVTGSDNATIVGFQLIGTVSDPTTGKSVSSNGNTETGAVALVAGDKLDWLLPVKGSGFSNVRGAGGDSTGNVYITGVITGDGVIGSTPVKGFASGSAFLAKLDHSGNVLWVRVLGNNDKDNGGELITFDDGKYVAISGVNAGGNYDLYDANQKLIAPLYQDIGGGSSNFRATLTVFDTNGNLVGTYSPKQSNYSNGGVLEYAGNGCIAFQLGYVGKITFHNGQTFTTDVSNPKHPDQDQALTKVCFPQLPKTNP